MTHKRTLLEGELSQKVETVVTTNWCTRILLQLHKMGNISVITRIIRNLPGRFQSHKYQGHQLWVHQHPSAWLCLQTAERMIMFWNETRTEGKFQLVYMYLVKYYILIYCILKNVKFEENASKQTTAVGFSKLNTASNPSNISY